MVKVICLSTRRRHLNVKHNIGFSCYFTSKWAINSYSYRKRNRFRNSATFSWTNQISKNLGTSSDSRLITKVSLLISFCQLERRFTCLASSWLWLRHMNLKHFLFLLLADWFFQLLKTIAYLVHIWWWFKNLSSFDNLWWFYSLLCQWWFINRSILYFCGG